jgi:hypothetical protein
LETRSSQVEVTLEKVNLAFEEFTTFYASLLEKGIDKTEYGNIFNEMAQTFKGIYSTSKANYDALLLNKKQFNEGRLERDAYERALTRIEQVIISADFDIQLKILPLLKKVEKEVLNQQIEIINATSMAEGDKKALKTDAEEIQSAMVSAEKRSAVDQVKDYVGLGQKIKILGKKVLSHLETVAKEALPIVIPAIIHVFSGV